MTDSLYVIPVPQDLVETIEYHFRDQLGTKILDLIAQHPSREARDAIVAAARIANPEAVITDDGIEIAPDGCFVDGVAYPEHAYTMYDGTICERCGAEVEPGRESSKIMPEPEESPEELIICRNAAGIGFTMHDFDNGFGSTCRRCDLPSRPMPPSDPGPAADLSRA